MNSPTECQANGTLAGELYEEQVYCNKYVPRAVRSNYLIEVPLGRSSDRINNYF